MSISVIISAWLVNPAALLLTSLVYYISHILLELGHGGWSGVSSPSL